MDSLTQIPSPCIVLKAPLSEPAAVRGYLLNHQLPKRKRESSKETLIMMCGPLVARDVHVCIAVQLQCSRAQQANDNQWENHP